MRFIYADSLDFVDPDYDFLTDSYQDGREVYWTDRFPHEMLRPAPYDGLLVSRAIVGGYGGAGKYTESQNMRLKRVGAREFLRFSGRDYEDSWLMGDCGAFSYHKLDEPPYSIDDTIEFYSDCNFSHGFSLDHVIFEFINNTRDMSGGSDLAKDRFHITQNNARDFLSACRQMPPTFTPIGIVQGWSPFSMANAAKSLVDMGYKFIGVGGMVPLKVSEIHSILSTIREIIGFSKDIGLHLLGFAKADNLDEFVQYGITSFDSTSPMLRAFKDDKNNYFTINKNNEFEYYSAIRIPQATENVRLRNQVKTGRYRQEQLVAMEQRALSAIRAYDKGNASLEATLDAVLAYSAPLLNGGDADEAKVNRILDRKRESYGSTLRDRPWANCNCAICSNAGVDTIIFRASNRNKRRGMHNLHVFYEYLNRLNNSK